MPSFRYRTTLIVGRWRATRREALDDAVRCRLAAWAGEPGEDVKWRFPGDIEQRDADPE
jgi:hypothetical protein